jgi:hypothetical protein
MATYISAFYHCQTDGLGGPPLEIAWAFVAPIELGLVSEIHLSRPPMPATFRGE